MTIQLASQIFAAISMVFLVCIAYTLNLWYSANKTVKELDDRVLKLQHFLEEARLAEEKYVDKYIELSIKYSCLLEKFENDSKNQGAEE